MIDAQVARRVEVVFLWPDYPAFTPQKSKCSVHRLKTVSDCPPPSLRLSAGDPPENTPNRDSFGHVSKNELQTVHGLGADCPQFKNQQHQKGHKNCSGDPELSAVGPRTVHRSKTKIHTEKLGSGQDEP
jgi:hypothetical protein